MTLVRGLDSGWFDVKTDEQYELKLFDSIQFISTAKHGEHGWEDRRTKVIPQIVTPNGLVVTNFTSDKARNKPMDNQSIDVAFEIKKVGKDDQEPLEWSTGFF